MTENLKNVENLKNQKVRIITGKSSYFELIIMP